MTIEQLKSAVIEDANDFYFEYNGKQCGVEQTVTNSIAIYDMWYGDKLKTYTDLDVLLNDSFFDGKAIHDIIDIVDIDFS